VKLGDKLYSTIWIIDHDEKRFHTFQELYHQDGWLSATGEGLTLHVNLAGPKVAPMPEDILGRIEAMAEAHGAPERPEGIGRKIGIRRKG
jgi:acyl-CoA thioester hydrolase